MNEIRKGESLKQLNSRQCRALLGEVRAGRTVTLAIQGMLAFAAFCSVPAAAQSAACHVSASELAKASVGALKRGYLRCDRASSEERLTLAAAVYCSAVSDELLRREFMGDLDLMLAWWRAARAAPTSE